MAIISNQPQPFGGIGFILTLACLITIFINNPVSAEEAKQGERNISDQRPKELIPVDIAPISVKGRELISAEEFHVKGDYPEPDEFVKITTLPEEIYKVSPAYPVVAIDQGLEGDVLIQALIDKEGNVVKAEVVTSIDLTDEEGNVVIDEKGNVVKVENRNRSTLRAFDEAAIKAAYGYQYKPATNEGKPVAVWVAYFVKFRI